MLNFTNFKDLLDMSNYMLAGFIIGMVIFFEVLVYLSWGFRDLSGGMEYFRWDFIEKFSNIQALGDVMYTSYAYLFILASFILLVAMAGVIILTFEVRGVIKRPVLLGA